MDAFRCAPTGPQSAKPASVGVDDPEAHSDGVIRRGYSAEDDLAVAGTQLTPEQSVFA